MGIPDVCPVLGIPLDQDPKGKGERSDNSPSLDKFIPSLGYVKGNIHIISWRANHLKNDAHQRIGGRSLNGVSRKT